jgi:hypothetical protein
MPAQTAGTLTGYPMDHYDGGRAACEPEHFTRSELGWAVRPRSEPDDDVRAVALAIIALTHCSD